MLNYEYIDINMLSGINGDTNNLITYSEELSNLLLISQNRFKWIDTNNKIYPLYNLSKCIEFLLCYYGQCCVVRDNNILKVKKCVGTGIINDYGTPLSFTTTNYNGGNTKIYNYNSKDFVWITNNDYQLPTTYWLFKYADRIAKVRRVLDLNIDAQKTPYIISTTPNKLLSIKNIFNKIRTMAEVIFMDETKGIRDSIKVLNLNAPFLGDKLNDMLTIEFNKALNFLGINTIDEKAERLISSEGEISKEITRNNVNIFLAPRKRAVEEIKNKFGIDLNLEYFGGITNNG